MKLLKKIMLSATLLCCALVLSGCADKVFLPEAHFTVVSVTPDKLRATVSETTTTEGETEKSSTVPSTVISLNADFGIPANLVSFSVTYTTRLGEPIPSVAIPETPYNLKLTPSTANDITLNPYTNRLYTMLELTRADISPVNARIQLTIEDANGNTTQVEAHCLCYATWDETEGGSFE